ncbi:EAL domain-containing protein [Actinoplanes sp. NEAU-A12]|uniref:EAL domain-containing protein n=1 Tax=Actinoplanes sandaracinus TaxID=3045177 RepID=A0ABT6WXF1_9ACTN|nr:EAL domain-containing protein [Actinoplanes sandaracinus]MDI6104426.1 EAL domain-containing protein [Actinoplanes sandaracinus]
MTRPSIRSATAVLALAAGWLVLAAGLGVAGLHRPLPPWLLWPAAVGAAGTIVLGCRIAAATGHGPVRVFWTRLAVANTVLTAGAAGRFLQVVINGPAAALSLVTTICYLTAVTLTVVAMLRLPGKRRAWRATLATVLDTAIVSVAAALVVSHILWNDSVPGAGHGKTAAMLLVVLGIACAALIAVIKVGVTGAGPVPAGALWALAPVGLMAPVSWMISPILHQWPHLGGTVVVMPVMGLLLGLAAWLQTRANLTPPDLTPRAEPLTGAVDRGRAWRRISLVPYCAVAVTATMMITVTVRSGFLTPGLAGGSVLLTVLVVTRQLAALLDNAELLDRLDDQAHHDDLTGLPNRRLFTGALARRTGPTTVAVCDLDGFAALNDRLGDDAGDALLRAAAERVAAVAGADAVVARLLGDEFGVLVPGVDTGLAETLVGAFRIPLRVDARDLLVTVTAGVAAGSGEAVTDLLRRAEVALQAAKYTGGDRGREHTSALDATAQHHAELAAALRRGLELGEFRLLYQPIVELPAGTVSGVEALVRWHPTGGPVISPAEFIPVAEHSGLILDLGAWIMDAACADAALWQRDHGSAGPRVNINVSARQLLDPDLPGMVADALHRHGLTPDRITIEITETAVFAGGAALETVRELRELGVGLALDDFGTGHSSLTLLRTCPVTTLKVDKSFIDDLNGTAEQEAIASSLSTIASTMGLRAVAEGVETRDQAERLHALGYRYAQGFYFARPVPASEIAALLDDPVLAS